MVHLLHRLYGVDAPADTHARARAFNGPFSGQLASTRKVKPIWILLKQEAASGSGMGHIA